MTVAKKITDVHLPECISVENRFKGKLTGYFLRLAKVLCSSVFFLVPFFSRFCLMTAMHSGKMYMFPSFRYGNMVVTITVFEMARLSDVYLV